jgi:uracil-DNA glycosylase
VPFGPVRGGVNGLPDPWRGALDSAESGRLAGLEARLEAEARQDEIYPPRPSRYRALELVPPDRVRVVVVGQDPYHGPGQAMGLAFSVPRGIRVPPSLANIFREVRADLGVAPPGDGDLSPWADEGVLLLNTSLSVRRGEPGSHAKYGWHAITAALLRHVSRVAPPSVFLLWGAHARARREAIVAAGHLVLEAGHPSPLSARRFLGCRHFSQANAFLGERGRGAVDWRLGERG